MAKSYEELTFADDFMFCKIMENNQDLCRELTELILGRKIGGILTIDKQKPIEVTADGPRVKFVLNGSTLVDADVSQYSTDGTVPADGIRRPGLHNKSGRIHWCGHGHNIFWRNIRIREIR